jgi:WD40 repeat protein
MWTLDGELIDVYENAHDGFIFTLAVNNEYLFSGGDDCVVHMWQGKERVSNLYHPNSVWDMCFDSSNLITGNIII